MNTVIPSGGGVETLCFYLPKRNMNWILVAILIFVLFRFYLPKRNMNDRVRVDGYSKRKSFYLPKRNMNGMGEIRQGCQSKSFYLPKRNMNFFRLSRILRSFIVFIFLRGI